MGLSKLGTSYLLRGGSIAGCAELAFIHHAVSGSIILDMPSYKVDLLCHGSPCTTRIYARTFLANYL